MPLLKPFRGLQLNRSHPLSRGLVGCWLMNEGGGNKIYDLSGNNSIGTITAALWTPGKSGSCLSFNGTSNYVLVPDNPILRISNNFTLILWFKSASTSQTNKYLLSRNQSSGGYQAAVIYEYVNDRVEFFAHAYTGTDPRTNSQMTISDTNWHQIVYSYNGSTWSGYIDGIQIFSVSRSFSLNTAALDGWYIGSANSSTAFVNGSVDSVMIFNRALSTAEVVLLYREPFCTFVPVYSRIMPVLAGAGIVGQVPLAGALSANSACSGTLNPIRSVAAVLHTLTGVSGSLTIVGQALLSGAVSAVSTLIGTLLAAGDRLWFAAYLNTERQWLIEALFAGVTANAFKLSLTLSSGWFWMRRTGCCTLYRGHTISSVDFANVLVVAEHDAEVISPPDYLGHSTNCTYFYVVRWFNSCGYQSRILSAVVRVSIDAQGNLPQPKPNNICSPAGWQEDGDKVELSWFYCPLRQNSEPACFNIYSDARTGQINYETTVATVIYRGPGLYSYKASVPEWGRYLFAIRAEDALGVQNNSLKRLAIEIEDIKCDMIEILKVEAS